MHEEAGKSETMVRNRANAREPRWQARGPSIRHQPGVWKAAFPVRSRPAADSAQRTRNLRICVGQPPGEKPNFRHAGMERQSMGHAGGAARPRGAFTNSRSA